MVQAREVATCTRCRQSKRKCDQAKPKCMRCERAGVQCAYDKEKENSPPSNRSDSGFQDTTPATTPPTPFAQRHGVKKRKRACLSCTRCHRLKVKCDKGEPCARCCQSGVEKACTYTNRPNPFDQPSEQAIEQPSQQIPFALIGEDPQWVVATWFLRKRGSTHYRAIIDRVRSISIEPCITVVWPGARN